MFKGAANTCIFHELVPIPYDRKKIRHTFWGLGFNFNFENILESVCFLVRKSNF